jgi:hypothetical protein
MWILLAVLEVWHRMKKIKTVTYLGSYYRRYFTFYQDLLDNHYCAFCDIEIDTGGLRRRRSINNCTKEYTISYDCYPVCKTHYVDPAGNLISVAPNEKD